MFFSHKIVRNVFSNWVSYLVAVIIGLFLTPFVVHTLGDNRYGIWAIVGSLTGYLGLFSLGVSNSLVKFVSQYRAREDAQSLNRLMGTALFIYSVLGTAVLGASVLLAHFCNSIFKVPPDYLGEMQWAIVIVGSNIGVSFFAGVFAGALAGSQRYDILCFIDTLLALLTAGLTVWFLSWGGGIIALALIALISTILRFFANFYFTRKEIPTLQFGGRYISKEAGKTILNYSAYIFLLGIAVRVIYYTDNLIIGSFLSMSAVTFYAIAGRLIEYLRSLIFGMSNVLNPASSEFDARQEAVKIRQLLIRGTKYAMYLVVPLGLGFVVFGEPFIFLWLGERYRITATVLTILMVPQFMALSQLTSGAILNGIGKPRFNALTACAEAAANLVLSIILVQYYGIIGVALGTAIPQFVMRGFIFPVCTCRIIGLRVREYFVKAFVLPILLAIPYGLMLVIFRKVIYPHTWGLFIAEVVFMAIFFYAMVLIWGMEKKELEMIPILTKLPLVRVLASRRRHPWGFRS